MMNKEILKHVYSEVDMPDQNVIRVRIVVFHQKESLTFSFMENSREDFAQFFEDIARKIRNVTHFEGEHDDKKT